MPSFTWLLPQWYTHSNIPPWIIKLTILNGHHTHHHQSLQYWLFQYLPNLSLQLQVTVHVSQHLFLLLSNSQGDDTVRLDTPPQRPKIKKGLRNLLKESAFLLDVKILPGHQHPSSKHLGATPSSNPKPSLWAALTLGHGTGSSRDQGSAPTCEMLSFWLLASVTWPLQALGGLLQLTYALYLSNENLHNKIQHSLNPY